MSSLNELLDQCTTFTDLSIDPALTFGLEKDLADELAQKIRDGFDYQQQLLWANRSHSVLLWLQGTDCSGKDGAIRNLLRGLNPQGVRVGDFQKPTPVQLQQPFLQRYQEQIPPAGYISVFNRTPYEAVVSDLADGFISAEQSEERLQQLYDFELSLKARNYHLLKVYLHISKDEQKRRLEQRLINPEKHWKISINDLAGHQRFDEIRTNWANVLGKAKTDQPWYIIPSDNKWLRNLLLAQLLHKTFAQLPLTWPQPSLPFGLEDLSRL